MFNTVILLGNLVRNVELRYTPNGKAVATFTVACNRKYGEHEEVFFGAVTVWGKMAEACNQHIGKGSQVLVEGRLLTESYEKDGDKRSSTKIIANQVKFVGKKQESTSDAPGPETGDLEPF